MKILLKISFFILIIFLWSCASVSTGDYSKKEKLLLKHLENWKNFRIDGIIELNYKSFSFRKNISLRKNEQAFRLDIFDAGIMGMHPTPFITVYIDTILVIRLPFQTENSKLDSLLDMEKIPDFSEILDVQELDDNKEKLIKSQKHQKENYTLLFSDKMLIEKILFNAHDSHINLKYDRNNEVTDLSIYLDGKDIANILVDEVIHEKIEIKRIE